jgi:hypothetical protein
MVLAVFDRDGRRVDRGPVWCGLSAADRPRVARLMATLSVLPRSRPGGATTLRALSAHAQSAALKLRRTAGREDIQLVGVIVLAGAALRFATLGSQSIWTDEALTAGYVHQGFRHMLIAIPGVDVNPPFFYVLEWVFVRVFGEGDAGLRVLSAVAGTLLLPVLYAIGASVASRRAGLIAAALAAVQPMLWWYSQEARAYSLFSLLSALALLAFVIALRDGSSWTLALWTLCGGLMLTTHYFALFLIAPQAIWLLAVWRGRRREVVVALAGLGIVAIGLSITFAQEIPLTTSLNQVPLGPRLRVLAPQLLASPSPPSTAVWVAALALLLAGAALALLAPAPSEPKFARVFAALAAWDVLVPILAGGGYLITRSLIGMFAPLLVLAGIGFASPRALRLGAALAAVTAAVWLGAVVAISAEPELQRIDTKAAIASLGPPTVDRVVLSEGTYLFNYTIPRYVTSSTPLTQHRVSVAEIDVLVPHPGPSQALCLAGQTCQLYPAGERPGPPAAGFQLVSRRQIVPFTVLRWRAPAPRELELSDVEASAPHSPSVPSIAVYQTARR